MRLALEVEPWLENRRRARERIALRREYETRVQAGEWPAHETLVPLFPYQREGMLHLTFNERALLADEVASAKRSRRSPRARCCTASAARGACWLSLRLRSRP